MCEILASYVPTWLAFPRQPVLFAEIWEHKITCEECRKDKERYEQWRKQYYAEKQVQKEIETHGGEVPGPVPVQPSGLPVAHGDVPGVPALAG